MPVTLDFLGATSRRGTFGQEGLDSLRRTYKTDSSFADALAAAPAKFAADSTIVSGGYANMFLLDVVPRESGGKATELDYVYSGLFNASVLPPGKNESDQAAGSATAAGVTINYVAEVSVYTWISRVKGVGGLAVPASNSVGGTQALAGADFAWNGSTGFSGSELDGQFVVGDIVAVYQNYGAYGASAAVIQVTAVGSGGAGSGTLLASFGGAFSGGNLAVVYRTASIPVAVDDIRTNVDLSSIIGSAEVAAWGALIIAAYFVVLNISTIKSDEIIPGQFWLNVQRITPTLLPKLA